MKILLINPPRSPENSIYKYAPKEAKPFVHRKLIGPPLGLLTIAAACKDYDVTVLEMKGEYDLVPSSPKPDKMVTQYLKKVNPDIVGVTFIASEFNLGIDIFKTVKKYNPDILTVAGGLHATLCPEDFTDRAVDVVCPGEAAYIFLDVVRAKEKNRPLSTVAGILLNTKEGLIKTKAPAKKCQSAGKDYIMPDRSYIKRWIPTYRVGNHPSPATYIFSSLGCPYKCTFCSIWSQYNGGYYQRSIDSIIKELKFLDDYDLVRFADANTIVNIKFINNLFDRILKEGIKKNYVMDIRFDTVVNHPKLIEKLAKAGLHVIVCGFESFRKDEMKKYNKSSSPALIEKAIDILHANGIKVRGNYVVPHYYEEDDFKALLDYASSHRVSFAGYTILTPMPGTLYYKEMKNQIIDHDLSKYNFFNCVLKTKMPLEKFYEKVGGMWLIKKGFDIL
jgi:radical SAM superfamily enzyme YgiQ (UPF0313 family)